VLQKVLQFCMDTFGEWLRGQRNAHKLTREEFANRVGCSVAMLRKMEDDERRPSAQIAELIANCLDIPLEERGTFIKVARGELTLDRLIHVLKRIPQINISPAQAAPRINLPVLPTPLIGRQREVDELSKTMNDPQCRILAIVGPGGIGKTRLAIETASQCQTDFADGVCFVPLAPVNSARFLVPVIADSIGLKLQSESSRDPKSQLFNYLNEKQILLLADNLEHLLSDSAVTDLFAELLESATKVKLLVTSRESLNLQGEWVFEVHGLPIPESADMEGTSVELFLQRARRAHVGFDPTTDDYPAILRICQLVNGMPLGIELAAAWVRTLSCDEIAREIELGLDFLAVSAKDLPPRHRSMRAVFDHSWKLLPNQEQKVLLRLSVFHGGFTRDAAEQVAEATLSMLSILVTKSLIRRSGTGRYDLHELIRQYTSEQLANQPKARTERSRSVKKEAHTRHARYFMKFLSQEDGSLRSGTQRESLAKLFIDIDNIRSAQEWALASQEFSLIESTLRAYLIVCDTLGWAQEGHDYLGRVQSVLESKLSLSISEQVALAHVLTTRALFAARMAQHESAHDLLNRSLEILRPLNEARILVEALTTFGGVKIITGEINGALKLLREGLQTARDLDDQWYEALCITELAGVSLMMGETDKIQEKFQSAVAAWRRTGDLRFTAFGLNSLSMSAIALGKYDEAQAALEESIAINRSVGDRWGLGNADRGLGLVAQAQEKHALAMDPFRKSLQIFTELGANWEVARLLSDMGRSTFALGKDSEAEHLWGKSLQLALETHGMSMAMESILGIASVQAKRGNDKYALQLLLIVINHPHTILRTKVPAEKLVNKVKDKLTSEEIEFVQTLVKNDSFESVVEEIRQYRST
jgi:predicted ATPase/transcriptional regulator with XRE-family HTH domain